MSEKKRQAPLPPGHGTRPDAASQMQPQGYGNPNNTSRGVSVKPAASSGYLVPIREVENSGGSDTAAKRGKRPSLPLPDYESLFPQKRHGVQGQTEWDHIIAEVNQKQRDHLADKEMSVDGPEEYSHSDRSVPMRSNQQKTQPQDVQSTSCKKALAPPPPKPKREFDFNTTQQGQSVAQTHLSIERPNASAATALGHTNPVTPSREVAPVKPRHDLRKMLDTSAIDNHAKSVSPAEIQRPASRVVSPAEIPRPASQVVSPAEIPRPASRVVSPAEIPRPDSQVVSPAEIPRPASRIVLDTTSADYQNVNPSNIPKEIPTAKPRQKIGSKDPVKSLESTIEEQENRPQLDQDGPDMRHSSPVMVRHTAVNVSREKKPSPDNTDKNHTLKKIMSAKEKLVEPDPFPSSEVLAKDQWAMPEQSHGGDDLFTGGMQTDHKFVDQGMTPDDLNKLFAPGNSADPFSSFNSNFSEEQPEQSKADMDSNEQSPYFKRGLPQSRKRASQSPTTSDKGSMANGTQDKLDSLRTETTTASTSRSLGLDRPEPQPDTTRQSYVDGRESVEPQAREEQWSADPFALPSSSPIPSVLITPEPLQSGVGESSSQTGVLSGSKTLLKAWVSPSEVQLSSNGGGPATTPRRPHPVKPMSSTENQPPPSMPVMREIKTLDNTMGKMKVTGVAESGPYTQLTQEELITLVVKQQTELSKKDFKIVELEEYIDNLLVRVIDEKPSILLGLNSSKSAL